MLRSIAEVDAHELAIKTEYSQRELRAYFMLDVIPVKPYAVRRCVARLDPLCQQLQGDVRGRGFSHGWYGCICHRCMYPRARRATYTQPKQLVKIKHNRWDNYVRPSHKCACGKTISDYRSKLCISCAAKQREAKKRNAHNS